jgi:uncharacterized protein YaiI (UPF0178 family)
MARELVLRTIKRRNFDAVFAANRPIPGVPEAQMAVCPATEGAADDLLVSAASPGDLAITRDIPLASRLVQKGAAVINDRGRVYTPDNIWEHLSIRDFTVNLAEIGLGVEHSPGYGKKDLKKFADALDRELAKLNP